MNFDLTNEIYNNNNIDTKSANSLQHAFCQLCLNQQWRYAQQQYFANPIATNVNNNSEDANSPIFYENMVIPMSVMFNNILLYFNGIIFN